MFTIAIKSNVLITSIQSIWCIKRLMKTREAVDMAQFLPDWYALTCNWTILGQTLGRQTSSIQIYFLVAPWRACEQRAGWGFEPHPRSFIKWGSLFENSYCITHPSSTQNLKSMRIKQNSGVMHWISCVLSTDQAHLLPLVSPLPTQFEGWHSVSTMLLQLMYQICLGNE